MSYINRAKFAEAICNFPSIDENTANAMIFLLHEQPSANVEEVKHGKWIVTKTEQSWNCGEYPVEYTCSLCGRTEKDAEPYCNCGAKMEV